MLKNENIICISSIDWDFVWQTHQEIMSTFSKNGNRVLFIENTGVRTPSIKDIPRLKKRVLAWLKSIKGFRKESENLYVYSPLALPFPYSRIARWVNRRLLLAPLRRWMKITEFRDPIIWTFLPTGIALHIIDNLESKFLIYYCLADFYELADNARKVKRTEDELISRCDLIFAQGKVLRDKCRRLNDNAYVFPLGVKFEVFEKFRLSPGKPPSDIQNIKRPVIGYIGGIHKHVDLDLLKFIAQSHPEWSIALVGPVQTNINKIKNMPNIFILGSKSFFHMPSYLSQFDVGIIPYRKTEYTVTVYPHKLNEYHAMGKPVVSTDLPEVANYNKEHADLVLIAKSHEEFAACIARALARTDADLASKRIAAARKNSWINKIEQMSDLIEAGIERKLAVPLNWRENFLKFYRQAHKRILSLVFIFCSIYLLIFYTPLVWFLASPLKIARSPQKADCIVVFGGGVGESGLPGQGYEERVGYAVELYQEGYTGHLVFSSGYKYVFEEPLVMRALAVSLGVPADAIILEDRAANTYENVKFTADIVEKNKWDKVMFISSPYNMRRVALVVKKVAPALRAIYTPIPGSYFYARGNARGGTWFYKQVNLRQIRALLHEVIGILYYFFKGYI